MLRNGGKVPNRHEHFKKLATELSRNVVSVIKRGEKLEKSGECAFFVVFFFCRRFKDLCKKRRVVIVESLWQMRVSTLESINGKIPPEEKEFVALLKKAFLAPQPNLTRQLLPLMKKECDDILPGQLASLLVADIKSAPFFKDAIVQLLNERQADDASLNADTLEKCIDILDSR